jgi:hypothetical protein
VVMQFSFRQAKKKPPRGWLVAVNEQVSWIDALLYWRGMQLTQGQ